MSWTPEDLDRHYERLKQPQEQGAAAPPPDDSSEEQIQAECVKLMEEDGWRALRTDPVSDKSRGKGFGEIGMADYLFMRPLYRHCGAHAGRANDYTRASSQILWVEFKARKGRLSMLQNVWHRNERARGFLTWIASVDFPASVDGFREHYANSGLMLRDRWW